MPAATYGGVPSSIMLPDPDEMIKLGREVVTNGRLRLLRERLSITRSAMAELLHTNTVTYASWERKPEMSLRPATAERVGRFFYAATKELELLDLEGYEIGTMIPFHVVATKLGIPQELLVQWYREGKVEATDAGIFGLWIDGTELARLRRQR